MDISIIIPTLNEAQYIRTTLQNIEDHKSGELQLEIIIVDSGSEDSTLDEVNGSVDVLHQDSSLAGAKYHSLNKGAELAKGRLLLFLDADTLLPKNFDLYITSALEKHEVIGGAFEFATDGRGGVYRVIEWINRMRYRIDKRYFGDQAIFCTKQIFEETAGYPAEPIMEAAYFCKVLRMNGKLALVKAPILTSARRFEEGNVFKVFLKDTWIWIQFTLGLNIKRYAVAYWDKNKNV